MLWGWLRITLALTERLSRLRARLSQSSTPADLDHSLLWAAVAVVLTPDPEAILLIRRADRHGDPWSGHTALPGGRREPQDVDLRATATRETFEEIGVDLSSATFVGSLADVVPRTPVLPPIAVRPYVFLVPRPPKLALNQEVASAQWVLLDELLDPGSYRTVQLELSGHMREVSAYQIEGSVVWGMTERILTNLLAHFR
jgi:8-oxo-dGTP pyrophosphatase MutT (NUDIX family)